MLVLVVFLLWAAVLRSFWGLLRGDRSLPAKLLRMQDDDMDDDDQEDENEAVKEKTNIPAGLARWREGIQKATTASQLAMAFYVMETSIAWHKSIMKAFCHLCHCGDNDASLLLCDGCDKGILFRFYDLCLFGILART